MNTFTPLTPKHPDGILSVLILGRISTPHQDMESVEASMEAAKAYLQSVHDGQVRYICLGEQASGMLADRETIRQAEELIANGEIDVVIVMELRAIFRNPRYQWAFIQDCYDRNVRVICVADSIDTADPRWEIMTHVAALKHGMVIPDTRRRVREKSAAAFEKGGMVQKIKFGYRKLSKEEAASGQHGPIGLRLVKLEAETSTIRKMGAMVMAGQSYVQVAEFLNDEGISPGLYVQTGRWTGRLVAGLLRDPILSGTRTFGDMLYEQVFKSGKHRSVPNPKGPLTKHYPELAHLSPEEHQSLLQVMVSRMPGTARPKGLKHPLAGRPRKRSRFPGQIATCGCCHDGMYRCDYYLKCENTLPDSRKSCWNHVQVNYEQVRNQVIGWLNSVLDSSPTLRKRIVDSAWDELSRVLARKRRTGSQTYERIADLEKQGKRLALAISKDDDNEFLTAQLTTVNDELQKARAELAAHRELEEDGTRFVSREQVDQSLKDALFWLAEHSLDFAELMRRLIPEFVIQPVQALDCPQVRPQAKLTLSNAAWTRSGEEPVSVHAVLDLFDPPVHIRHLPECVRAKNQSPDDSVRALSEKLGLNQNTVYRALRYAEMMEEQGMQTPYRELKTPPANASRWKKRTNDPPAS